VHGTDFHNAYAEQNRRDQIAYSTLATILSMVLNLACSVMDHVAYPQHARLFLEVRLCSIAIVALVWLWFIRTGRKHHRVFGIMWYASPLAIILWMIYAAADPVSPYYAGLNIVLLAVGVLSPWTYIQNLISAAIVILLYVLVSLGISVHQPLATLINNMTFLLLTAVIVVASSIANARQRFREFELRWELHRSRGQLEENNRRLVELDEAKSRFFANISHELRTPLTLLIAPLETLLNRHRARLSPEMLDLMQTMHGNSLRLLKLINDLLNIVRLESGKVEVQREPVVMAEFVRGLISATRQMAEDKRITLAAEVAPAVGCLLVDRDKLEKILFNLVFNALKFTPAGGRVDLQVSRDAAQLVLVVRDTGMGISKEKLPQVFIRFWQADDSSSRKFQGVGIGLSLVKEFTEVQGGTVAVASESGQGSTFTVRLPYLEATDGATAPAPAAVAEPNAASQEWLASLYRRAELFPAGAGVRTASRNGDAASHLPSVLLADDEPDMLRFMHSQLGGHYRVIEAVDGVEAVRKATETPPDLVLTDMMMPQKNGLDVCRELRANPATRSIPVVMITARADEETKLAALNAGANDFLPKPFSTTELHVRVKNLMDSYNYQRWLAEKNSALESAIEQIKETETALVQSEKMASLGLMSAGLMHEINNPIMFATTGLYELRRKLEHLPSDLREDFEKVLGEMEAGIKRVVTLVSEMQKFAYQDRAGSSKLVPVESAMNMALSFLSREIKGSVEVIQNLPAGLTACANEVGLSQAFMNLLKNSIDATRNKKYVAGHPTIWIEGRSEGGRSFVVIRDNGPGIQPEHLGKVFDPFFTTKEIGKGTGLGLSISYRVVERFGGRIHLPRTEYGKFCEFTIELPASVPAAPPQ
jgi:signal transduction histidine kinase